MLVPLLMLIGVLDAAAEADTCAVADSPSKFNSSFRHPEGYGRRRELERSTMNCRPRRHSTSATEDAKKVTSAKDLRKTRA
jgi:hypothetical protein